jgi:hypothetical protein
MFRQLNRRGAAFRLLDDFAGWLLPAPIPLRIAMLE